MPLSGVDLAGWALSLSGQVSLFLVLIFRKRVTQFPIFTAFVAEGILRSIITAFFFHHLLTVWYKHFFWAAGIFDECLQFLVLCEIAFQVFAPTGKWAVDTRRTAVFMGTISAFVAVFLSWLANPATRHPIQTFILRSDFFDALLMSELFVGMVLLSTTVGLPWKTHAARIAQGLGAFSIICIGLDVAKIFYGLQQNSHHFDQLNRIRGFAYVLCEIYWIVMLWAQAPSPVELPQALRIQIYTLQRQVENDLIKIRAWRRH